MSDYVLNCAAHNSFGQHLYEQCSDEADAGLCPLWVNARDEVQPKAAYAALLAFGHVQILPVLLSGFIYFTAVP